MSDHTGHDLFYVYDRAVVQTPCTITPTGDVKVGEYFPSVVRVDGDCYIFCETCDQRVYSGEGGLARDWTAV